MDKSEQQDNIQYSEGLKDAYEHGKTSVKHKQKERKVRKQRKKLKRLKAFFRFIVFVCLCFLVYFFLKLPQWYLPSDAFSKPNGKTVEIINNKIVTSKIIYKSLENLKVPHVPIFLMNVSQIKRELFKIPVVKRVYVRRYGFPARIQIIIRERKPVVVIKTSLDVKPVAFKTSDGIIVTNKEYMPFAESKSTLTVLTGQFKVGPDWTIKKIENIEKITKAVEAYSGEKVQYIDMRNPNDVYVRIESTNIRLGVLDSTVFERIKRIYAILPQIHDVNETIKYIDLSWDKVNYLKLQKETEKNNKDKNDISEKVQQH